MKINITTNHIRIYRLLNFLPEKNIEFIAKFLNMSKQNVILYIKQIYYFVDNKTSGTLLQSIINDILNSKNLLLTLKKNQIFTKDDRVFYITLKLLRDSNLNLNTLALTLNVSRRTLHDDLIDIKKNIKFYDLEISSLPSKGITILGDIYNLKNCALSYLFKFLIEVNELPILMLQDYSDFFQKNTYKKLDNDIEYFTYAFEFDIFANNKKLIKSLYIIYGYENQDNPISSLSYDEFRRYFISTFTTKNMEKVYSFFKSSVLGGFPIKDIQTLILTLKFCNGTLKKEDILVEKECNTLKNIFLKNVSFSLAENNFFEKFIYRVVVASNESSFLNMTDLSYLKINLSDRIKFECSLLFFDLRKIYYNIQFSNIVYFYLWSLNRSNILEASETIVVFKDLPKFLHPLIKNSFFLKENIRISHFIKDYELDSYLLKEDSLSVITFEKLNLCSRYPFIKYYPLPLKP